MRLQRRLLEGFGVLRAAEVRHGHRVLPEDPGQLVALGAGGQFRPLPDPNGPYHSAHVWIMGTPPRKKQPFDPSAPGMSPTPAPELIGTQARSAGWPMAPSFSWFSAVEEQPARTTLPLDHSCALIQSRVSCPSAVVVVRKPKSPSDHSLPRSFCMTST